MISGVVIEVRPFRDGPWHWHPYKLRGESCQLYKPHGSLNWLYCRACQKLDVTAGMKSTHYIFSDPALVCQVTGSSSSRATRRFT
jgi:hypothetical protein